MKKFILKTCYFTVPFITLYFINYFFYKKDQGDLARLGYIYHNPSPSSEVFTKYEPLEKKYSLISESNLDKNINLKILTIGDSFSEQGLVGYQNILANKGISIGHIDRFLSEENPIQVLIELVNSDFFNKVKTDYVILQTVERAATIRTSDLSFTSHKTVNDIKVQINEHQKKETKTNTNLSQNVEFFSDATIKIPLFNLQYLFLNRPLHSDIYRFKSNNNLLFSNNPSDLLFFKDDIKNLPLKNNIENISNTNIAFNKIQQLLIKKGIKLIVLIAPDKYDLYYPYIKDKPNGKEPIFFQEFDKMQKEYLYIPSYSILSDRIKKEKNVYLYDDTHWSMDGANAIAEHIFNLIQNEQKTAQ